MIDLQKLISECDFHLKRGDNMSMPPKLLKELAERLLVEDEEFEQVQTGRDFAAEQVEAAKALQPAPEVAELVQVLRKALPYLEWMLVNQGFRGDLPDDFNQVKEALAKHGGNNG